MKTSDCADKRLEVCWQIVYHLDTPCNEVWTHAELVMSNETRGVPNVETSGLVTGVPAGFRRERPKSGYGG
jgi:hypothetical protein